MLSKYYKKVNISFLLLCVSQFICRYFKKFNFLKFCRQTTQHKNYLPFDKNTVKHFFSKYISLFLIIFSVLITTSCGYHLRGFDKSYLNIQNIYLNYSNVNFDQINDRFIHNLANNLRAQNIQVSTKPNNTSPYQLTINKAHYTKLIISKGSSNIVTQYKIIYNVDFSFYKQQKPLLSKQHIAIQRNYNYTQEQILGLGDEEDIITNEIIQEITDKIIAQLSVATR